MRAPSVLSAVLLACGPVLLPLPAHAAVPETPRVRAAAAHVFTTIVDYTCTSEGETQPQSIKVQVELTMPTAATPNTQATIGWRGTYTGGTGLKAPAAGLTTGSSLYASAGISGMSGLTSATGVGTLTAVEANQVIPLPTATVELKTTPSAAGTGLVKPGALNFGTTPQSAVIECDAINKDLLTTYDLVVGETGGTSPATDTDTGTDTGTDTDTGTGTGTTTDTGTDTGTDTDTEDAAGGEVDETPAGSAATGGGGEAGPDGRPLVVTGSLLVFTAVGGLLMRRRRIAR
ncbi:hypothetical protein ACLQ2R_08530 [Streptosporangium sp. DT93]|uniref:hypothetical protein n=1 Tax=Streptosporangium sp. DT93 TaxID=3393428 RepID=UPI003CF2FBD0